MLKKIFVVLCVLWSAIATAQTVRVAGAASLQYVLEDIGRAFAAQSGHRIEASYGASGKLATQIQHGAPFEVFVSADTVTPQALQAAGVANAPRVYAYGRLVLWTMRDDLSMTDWRAALTDARVQHIALANPKLAPYGLEAERFLTAAQLAPPLAGKLVFGESIAQVNQYVTSGAAEIGFTAKSIVMAPAQQGQGRWVELPTTLYRPIPQAVVKLKAATPAATQFVDFLFQPAARAIWQRYGYQLP